jgi:hypothetical protein
MRVPLKVDNPITSKVGKYIKCGPFFFCKSNVGAKNKDPRM